MDGLLRMTQTRVNRHHFVCTQIVLPDNVDFKVKKSDSLYFEYHYLLLASFLFFKFHMEDSLLL